MSKASSMKKEVLSVLLVVLLLNAVAAANIGSNTLVTTAQAQSIPTMCIDPPETKDPLLGVGDMFTVKINISNVENMFGWQAKIFFNRAVVNVTSKSRIYPDPWFSEWFGGGCTFQRFIDYAEGYLLVVSAKMPPYEPGEIGATGSGILAYINFTVVAEERATLLQFGDDTNLRTVIGDPPVSVPLEPFTVEDGSFDNRPPPTNISPVAAFENASLGTKPEGETIRFNASSSYDPDAWLERYTWDYGDGITEIYTYPKSASVYSDQVHRGNWTASVIHAYEHAGIYKVKLTVTDNDGRTATITKDLMVPGHDIAINDVKTLYIAVMPGVPVPINVNVSNNGNYTETFDVNVYFNETLIETRNFADMPAYSETTLIITWNTTSVALGRYVLKANASQVAGEIHTLNNAYVDGVVAIASSNAFQFQTLVAGRTFIVQVESTSIAAGFEFNRAEKKIGFSLTGDLGWFSNVTIPMALLNVSSPNAWIVKLDGKNITYTATLNGTHYFIYFDYIQSVEPYAIEIIGETAATPPVALFTVSKTTAIAGESLTFNASTSYDADGTVESWTWDFQGEADSGEVVQHSFAANGNYFVTLTIKDNEQLTNSTTKTITVIDYPIAGFSYSPSELLVDQAITFNATISNPVGGTITEYAWKFGDGRTGTGKTTTHSYLTAGTFTVNLTVTDSEGLTDFTTKTITVKIHDIAITSLTATPPTVRMGDIVTIQITAGNNGNFTESFTITAYYHNATTNVTIETRSITNLDSGNSQLLTILWNTTATAPNTYTIKAVTSTIIGETRTEDNILTDVTVNVQRKISSLTIDPSSATVTLGSNTTIKGTLTPILQGKTITLQYRIVGQTGWGTLSTTTDAQGKYQFTWTPTLAGTYEIQAIWQGDANTEDCKSVIKPITVKEAEAPSIPIQYVAGAIAAIIILIVIVAYFLRARKH